jgi:glycosyltransferase involved in cell wall biosynthesis
MPAAYAVADCLILPSDHGETWGLVVNEAMACGLPAITSDRVGCHPDLIIPGLTGAVFPCGDSAALAEAMGRLAADPERLAVMGQAAREHVKAYSIDALLEGTLAALRLACGR